MVACNVLALLTFSYAEPTHFSTWEMVLLGMFVVASLGLFWARFGQVVARIRASKKDPNFKIGNVGKRVWDFFWEVICQAKVIQQRPLPGLAHAFVFWGFCIFALVSLNHIAAGFGLGFLSPDGLFVRFYTISRRSLLCSLPFQSSVCLSGDLSSIRSGWERKFLMNQDSSRS